MILPKEASSLYDLDAWTEHRFIKSTWFMDDCEVKLGEEEGPAGLSAG